MEFSENKQSMLQNFNMQALKLRFTAASEPEDDADFLFACRITLFLISSLSACLNSPAFSLSASSLSQLSWFSSEVGPRFDIPHTSLRIENDYVRCEVNFRDRKMHENKGDAKKHCIPAIIDCEFCDAF
jgi:hypothetical protein